MSVTHWKKLTNPDFLGAYEFQPKETKILTIKQVKEELVTGAEGKKEQCIVARFQEQTKPMILNKTNCKIIAKLYNTPYIENWAGCAIEIEVKAVKAFGEVVDALRVKQSKPKKLEPVSEILTCADCGKSIEPFKEYSERWMADYTRKKYGRQLCVDCGEKAKKELEKNVE